MLCHGLGLLCIDSTKLKTRHMKICHLPILDLTWTTTYTYLYNCQLEVHQYIQAACEAFAQLVVPGTLTLYAVTGPAGLVQTRQIEVDPKQLQSAWQSKKK